MAQMLLSLLSQPLLCHLPSRSGVSGGLYLRLGRQSIAVADARERESTPLVGNFPVYLTSMEHKSQLMHICFNLKLIKCKDSILWPPNFT